MRKRVTLADIAKEVGVSINTVSHALNDKNDISDEMKKRINDVAEKMGYIRNSFASYMRSGKSKCVSVIVGDISNPHFSIIVKEIETIAKKNGYSTFVINTNENDKTEREAIITSISKNVDGIIICPVQKNTHNIQLLINNNIPFTLIGRRFDNLDTNYVVCDDRNSGYIACKHFLKKGHRKIAVLNGPSYISSAFERLEGIKSAFTEYGLSLDDEDIYTLSVTSGNHQKQINAVLEKDYTAVICFSDIIALEFTTLVGDKDIDIISFDNIRSKFIMPTNFTSISSSKTKMSHKAFDILMRNIEDRELPNYHVVLSTKIATPRQ